MKKPLYCALIVLLGLSLIGCFNAFGPTLPPRTDESDQAAVKELVEDLGSRLQMVSLLAPKDVVSKSMEENYGDLVSPALLQEWQEDPASAPGRLTSSPWPDRIEIADLEKSSGDEYQVTGEIIEVTSVEKADGGAAAKRLIDLVVKRLKDRWLIETVMLGEYTEITTIVHRETNYGFSFALPKSWTGYSVVTKEWEGYTPSDQGTQADEPAVTGPLLLIRHPQWTQETQRQDIPIMVFTLSQWNALRKGEYHIGAAPIGPSELGRNAEYVFALPARYNYAFPQALRK